MVKKKFKALDDLICCCDAKLLKSLGEPVRLEILRYLFINGRSDVNSISKNLPQDRSVISRHLNYMQEAGILTCEKEGRHMFYKIDANVFLNKLKTMTSQIKECISQCCSQEKGDTY